MRVGGIGAVLLAISLAVPGIPFAAPACPSPSLVSFDARDGAFTIESGTSQGCLTVTGTALPARIDAAARLAERTEIHTLDVTRVGDGIEVRLDFGSLGAMAYGLDADGHGRILWTSIPPGGCEILANDPLFLALQEAFLALQTVDRRWTVSERFTEEILVVNSLAFFFAGTDLLEDCRRVARLHDNYGCDGVIGSCGPAGHCCDEHDRCYAERGCRAESWACLVPEDLSSTANEALCAYGGGRICNECNRDVLGCILLSPFEPAPSECCAMDNCGEPRPPVQTNKR